jgi:hypothetical protein
MENYSSKASMTQYSVRIDNLVYQKIMHWIDKATGEVSGLGKLTIDKETGVIDIKSAILLKQSNTGTSTEIEAEAIAKAMYETRNDEGHLNFWWHSHVNMNVFWSGTDLDTIRDIGKQGFVVATVFNKKREMLSCLYRKGDDIFPETFIDGLDTKIVDFIDNTLIEQWDKEFDEKCSVAKPDIKTVDWSSLNTNVTQSISDKYGYDWYKGWSYTDDIKQPRFDFDDIDGSTDQVKIDTLKPELNDMQDDMLSQKSWGKARHILNKICKRINGLKLKDEAKSYDLKQMYIQAFNKEHGSYIKGA